MSQRIKELDALRGIAALFVVLFHYTMGTPEANLGFKYGVTGVDLFFIISGFVIFMSIQKVSSGLEFAINRFTRLYPTYWTCATITFLCQIFVHYQLGMENSSNIGLYLVNLTMFQHYFKVGDIDGPYWTLIIEMIFYIGILILFVTKKLKYILHIGIIIVLLISVYSVLLVDTYPDLNWDFIYWFPLYSHVSLFVAGIIFYKIFQNEGKWYINYLLLIICLSVQSSLFAYIPKAALFISNSEYSMMLAFYFAVFCLFVNHKLKFIVSKPTLFIGKISFALYLIHQFVSIEFIIPVLQKQVTSNFWITSCIALFVSISLATFITYAIEIPLGKKLNSKLKLKLKVPISHP
jgi:peptidoglycan/LPS O-acetylase OafA/YrhL